MIKAHQLPTERELLRWDETCSLSSFRSEFEFPEKKLYFCGHSLGLMPKSARDLVNEEFNNWKQYAVAAHFNSKTPWFSYHECVSASLAQLVGGKNCEVVAQNTLTTNLHLLFVSFFRPHSKRKKILMEGNSFPSDRYAVCSQIKFHGGNPKTDLIEIFPDKDQDTLDKHQIIDCIEKNHEDLALVYFSGVHYLTGEYYPLKDIAKTCQKFNIPFGLDLAHAIGNVTMNLHDWGVDFATWCSYKYLNAGPGAIGGLFVHEKHFKENKIEGLPRFAGWWGHNKETRFLMGPQFDPIQSAESWQLSNPSIFNLATLRASLDLFDRAKIEKLRDKSLRLTNLLESYLLEILEILPHSPFSFVTPKASERRGAMITIKFSSVNDATKLFKFLQTSSVELDFRHPNILRLTPIPLYNSFHDVFILAEKIRNYFSGSSS